MELPKPSPTDCPLPADASWCQVRLANLAPFWMAVYKSGAGAANDTRDWVSWNICHMGFWEDQDIGAFGPPGSMLDIGGSVGYHTFAFAQAGWTVNAFEPLAANLALQVATMCANPAFAKNVTIHPHGLGIAAQTCQLVSPKDNEGWGFTKCGAEGEANTTDDNFYVIGTFDVRRLDGVLEEKSIPDVDLVKIDVDGYEAQVFAGAPNFLASYYPRLIKSEVWENMTGSTGVEYLTMFENAGYDIFTDPGCTNSSDKHATGDVFMCRKVLQEMSSGKHATGDKVIYSHRHAKSSRKHATADQVIYYQDTNSSDTSSSVASALAALPAAVPVGAHAAQPVPAAPGANTPPPLAAAVVPVVPALPAAVPAGASAAFADVILAFKEFVHP